MDGIPHSTLANIAKTGFVPQKWRHLFHGVSAVNDLPRIAIHKENMESPTETILKHVKPRAKVEELIFFIQNRLKQQTY